MNQLAPITDEYFILFYNSCFSRVSVDGHTLSVISSDGYDFEPVSVESFILNPGERYDFIITTNRSAGNYWIRAVSLEKSQNHTAEAILHYEGSVLQSDYDSHVV